MTIYTTMLYSKHRVLHIPQLLIFYLPNQCTLQNGEPPKHFDNYFSDIASVHTYQPRLALLQKCGIIYQEWKLLLKGYWFQNVVWYSWSLKISLALLIWETIQKRPAILSIFPLSFVSYACPLSVILFAVLLFSFIPFTSPLAHHTPRTLPPLFFVVVLFIYLIWRWFDAFCYFSLMACETPPSIKNWFMLTQGWLSSWPI